MSEKKCRSDGRCQYAIDCGAEGMGHCPAGKCLLPEHASEMRRHAEYMYSMTAFDYEKTPIGSRDWALFWAGYQAMVKDIDDGMVMGEVRALETKYGMMKATYEAELREMRSLLMELVDLEGPQPGNSAWGDKVLTVLARSSGKAA